MNHRGGFPEPFPYGIPTVKNQPEDTSPNHGQKSEFSALGNAARKTRIGQYRESEEVEEDGSLFSTYSVAQPAYHAGRTEKDLGLSLGSTYQQMAQSFSSGPFYGSGTNGVSGGAGGFGGFSQVSAGNGGNSERSRAGPFGFQRSLSYNTPNSSVAFSALGVSHGSSNGSGTINPNPNRASAHGSSGILSQMPSANGQAPGMSNVSPLRGGQQTTNSRLLPLSTPLTAASGGLPPSPYRISRSTSQPAGAGPNFSSFNGTSQDLDASDFPTFNHSSRAAAGNLGSLSSRGFSLLSKPQEQEFTIHNEDFPALPNSRYKLQPRESMSASLTDSRLSPGVLDSPTGMHNSGRITGSVPLEGGKDVGGGRVSSVGVIGQKPARSQESLSAPAHHSSAMSEWGVRTSTDGTVTNIPVGMVTDQFGLIGLLTFIRSADSNPNQVALALGSDLKSLGLNLTSQENLYSSFTSPFGEGPPRPQDIDYSVPKEYFTYVHIRDKLAPIKLHRYSEDLLFYIYYHSCGDFLQLAAGAELYHRDWRYHMKERVWLKRIPRVEPFDKSGLVERGLYYVFDVARWRKVKRELQIWYDQLEERSQMVVQSRP